ncbi:MAG: hypothetical protein WC831_04125 [Parcubacteria group bacterium]
MLLFALNFALSDFSSAQSGEDPLAGTSVDEVMKNNAAATSAAATPESTAAGTPSSSSYLNQEKIPGFGQTSDFPTYLKQIINFGFAVIGIMAMFMLMIGAYQYLMAAGNIAKEENAKTTVSSALSGLILGLIAYVLLQTINPDLVAFKLDALKIGSSGTSNVSGTGSGGGGAGNTGKGTGSGKCEPVASGPCSESNLKNTCFGSGSYQASSICNAESGGGAGQTSKSDITADGHSFSVGLFQINLTVHDIGGLNCPSAFSGKNYKAVVVDEGLYQQCVQAAQDPTNNIKKACSIGNNGSSWSQWGANKICGF